jgi:hypothetical protein
MVPKSSGGGAGTITQVESTDGSVTVTNGTGPVVNLTNAGGGSGTISHLTSTGATVSITNPTGPTTDLEVGIVATQSISGTAGSAALVEYETASGSIYTVLAFAGYTGSGPQTLTFTIPATAGNIGIPSWGASPALTLTATTVIIPIIGSALTGSFVILGF